MILLFLGSWRSTMIVCISIPLSILTSLIILNLLGPDHQRDDPGRHGAGGRHPGGRRHRGRSRTFTATWRMKKPLVRAVLDGAQQIAAPAFVSTLSICIVFVPVLLLTGAAEVPVHPAGHGRGVRDDGFLFPLADAGGDHGAPHAWRGHEASRRGTRRAAASGPFRGIHLVFNRGFESMRASYAIAAALVARSPRFPFWPCFALFVAGTLWLAPLIGRDFFPTVDSGQMRLHARAPSGTRLEQTELYFADHRERNPPGDSRRRDRYHHRHSSASPWAASTWRTATPPRSAGRRRHPDLAEATSTAHCRLHRPVRQSACTRSSPTSRSSSNRPTSPIRF